MGINLDDWNNKFVVNKQGGHGTRDRARQTWRALDRFVEKEGWQGVTTQNISPKQVRLFLESRAEKIGARSLQNELSHIRRALEGARRDLGDISDPKGSWSNARMGLEPASRIGGKAAISLTVFNERKENLTPSVRALAELVNALGMRKEEAILAGPQLEHYIKECTRGLDENRPVFVEVKWGKGGRDRMVWLPQERLQQVIEASSRCLDIVQKNGTGYIIPLDDLKEAKAHFSNQFTAAGLTGSNSAHGLRRLWAHDQYAFYLREGLDERQALARLSNDLGHGDGRGRWVWNNYLSGGKG